MENSILLMMDVCIIVVSVCVCTRRQCDLLEINNDNEEIAESADQTQINLDFRIWF